MPYRYLLFFKPYGVISDSPDPDGRPTVADMAPADGLFPVGRLDLGSEGLMLLTDDGALAHRLTHPGHKLPKTYFVQVENVPSTAAVVALRRGAPIKGERLAAAEVELLAAAPDLPPRAVPIRDQPSIPTAWLRVVLREGKKRQIRHMTAAVGHPTLRLVRVAIGPLTARGLQPGQWRELSEAELSALKGALERGNMDHARDSGPAGRRRADDNRPDRQLLAPDRGNRPDGAAHQQRDRGEPGRPRDRRRAGSRAR